MEMAIKRGIVVILGLLLQISLSLLVYLFFIEHVAIINAIYGIINKRGERIKSRGIELMVKKSYDKAGLNSQKYGVHTLRHTCATILYRIGVDIKIIQEILGHVQVGTTEIYTHLFDKDVMAEMLKHPLSKFIR